MFFSTTIIVALFSTQAVANVIQVPLQRSLIVGVGVLKDHLEYVKTKYCDTLAAFQANTGSPHPLALAIDGTTLGNCHQSASGSGTRDAHQKREDISLTDEVTSNIWMGTISVGTPPQNFTVDFDTGSADLILPNQTCDSSCDGHTRYNPAASSTAVDLGRTFVMTYNGGSGVNGTQYTDNVFMGGYEAAKQTLGAATTYSGMQSATFPPDGLLGLGFAPISNLRAPPVFQTMVSAGVLPQGVFSFALSSQPGQSELTIGGTNAAMYQASTVEYVNVSMQAYWQLPLAGLARPGLNNASGVVVVDKTSYAQSIIDTGTAMIITTDSNAQVFYANVTGAAQIGGGLWSVPCDIVGSLAPTLTYGSRSFPVSASTFNLGPVSQGSTNCIGGLAGGGSAYWIIGDVFLQNVYTIFDLVNIRVGFADLV